MKNGMLSRDDFTLRYQQWFSFLKGVYAERLTSRGPSSRFVRLLFAPARTEFTAATMNIW